jgi:6-phosphogluconate dehydrogenase
LKASIENEIPVPVLNSSYNYFMSLTEERLPANLIQAQRDFFGAHTFERVDREGVFHINWQEGEIE